MPRKPVRSVTCRVWCSLSPEGARFALPRAGGKGATAVSKPSLAASFNRCGVRGTGRTSPVSPISPNSTVSAGTGCLEIEDTSAAATARSAAGSLSRRPPATLRNTSWLAKLMPLRLSSTASTMASRPLSQPTTVRRGVPSGEGLTSA